jgi:glycosidase
VLKELVKMGVTHVWLTGVLRHATCTEYPGLSAQPESIVKGIAGSPYAVVDYYDVDPDLAENVPQRMGEFEALLKRCRHLGLVPMIDFIPNHVSRAYCTQHPGGEQFGGGDNKTRFFDPNNAFYYLQSRMGQGHAPFRLPSGEWKKELYVARVTGNNAVTWQPSVFDWYETVKLNYGYNFIEGPKAAKGLPGMATPLAEAPRTWQIMDDILAFWQSKGVQGFRCDMAHMVPTAFWRWAIARARVRERSVYFVAEAYDDPMKATEGNPLYELVQAGFEGVYDADMYHLACNIYEQGAWANDMDRQNNSANFMMEHGVRFVENHDEVRMSSPQRWGGHGKAVMPAVLTALFGASRGPVLIYNGQEFGEDASGPSGFGGTDGRTSIFDYTCLPHLQKWYAAGKVNKDSLPADDFKLAVFHRRLLRALQHPALSDGEFYGLNWSNMQTEDYGRGPGDEVSGHWAYSCLRYDRKSKEAFLVVANLSPDHDAEPMHVSIPQPALDWCQQHGPWIEFVNILDKKQEPIVASVEAITTTGVALKLARGSAMILRMKSQDQAPED